MVLARERAWQFSLAGTVGRLPIAMFGLALILLVERSHGTYALAGLVAGVYALGTGAGQLVIAPLIDRFGQTRVVSPQLGLFVSAFAALLLVVRAGGAAEVIVGLAGVAGFLQPGVGALVRARWAVVAGPYASIRTAYAIEGSVDQLVFVLGPPMVVMISAQLGAEVALQLAVALTVVGGLGVLAHRRSAPPPERYRTRREVSGPDRGAMIGVVAVLIMIGAVFGSVDVAVIAHADEIGAPRTAGALLMMFSITGLAASIAYGASTTLETRGWMMVGLAPCAGGSLIVATLWSHTLVIAAVLLTTGALIAPLLIWAFTALEDLAPLGSLTAYLGYGVAGSTFGMSLALASAAWVVDRYSSAHGFLIAAVASAVLTLLCRPMRLRRGTAGLRGCR